MTLGPQKLGTQNIMLFNPCDSEDKRQKDTPYKTFQKGCSMNFYDWLLYVKCDLICIEHNFICACVVI